MSENAMYELKAQKYKQKYLQLKYQLQYGGAKFTRLMDIIELFRKLDHSVEILVSIVDENQKQELREKLKVLKPLIQQLKDSPQMKSEYGQYYIIGGLLKEDHTHRDMAVILKSIIENILFTMRQDTTKAIGLIPTKPDIGIKQLTSYISILDQLLKMEKFNKQFSDFKEIKGKCASLIKVAEAKKRQTELNEPFIKGSEEDLDLLRQKTNEILHYLAMYKKDINLYIPLIEDSRKLIEDFSIKELIKTYTNLSLEDQISLFSQIASKTSVK